VAVAPILSIDEVQEIIFGAGCLRGVAAPSHRLRVCVDSRSAEHEMLRLDAVLADEQDPGLLQNNDIRTCS
jgi:hypothetical protein